jgi:hypothetical protein
MLRQYKDNKDRSLETVIFVVIATNGGSPPCPVLLSLPRQAQSRASDNASTSADCRWCWNGTICGLSTPAHQNDNPVKVLTFGLERKAEQPFWASGKERFLERVEWWKDYGESFTCVFGHYGRLPPTQEEAGGELFDEKGPYAALGNGNAWCIDYSIAKRWKERFGPHARGPFRARLAALRWPEGQLVFDDGGQAAGE